MMPGARCWIVAGLWAVVLPALAVAQAEAGASAPIRAERVAEILEYLASDERAGRDSPSPGLAAAARFLAEAFTAAGLDPGGALGESTIETGERAEYYHHYSVPGTELDSGQVELVLLGADGEELELSSGDDVRLWQSGRPFEADRVECRVQVPGDAGGRRARFGSRTPTLVSVPAASPLWRAAGGRRQVIARRAPGTAPVLLVRQDLLPDDAPEVAARLRVPGPKQVDVPLVNVVGVLPGTTRRDEFVLVTAHYDHIGVGLSAGADVIFNGADDNATGTTAVLTLAEALGKRTKPLARSLLFVCFSAEEKGLLGSRAFVADPPVPLARIAVVVNLEMLGRPTAEQKQCAWVTGAALSDFEDIARPALARAGIGCIDFPMAAGLFQASDNFPFAQAGVVAHSISAGTLHGDYHRPGDSTDKIDIEHMTAVICGLYEVVVELADRDARPSYNEAGRRSLDLPEEPRKRGF